MTRSIPTKWVAIISLLLATATVSLYSPVIGFPFINYDDPDYVIENQHVLAGMSGKTIRWAFAATEKANWHPLTWLSHALDYQLYGLNAGGHHFSSLLFHVLNAILLFLFLTRITGAAGRSAFVAALFALHPFSVESVVWISERKNVLSTFFFMLALGAYSWYVRQPNLKRYAMVSMLFILGLASKPMVITLPFVLLLLDYWPLGRFQGWQNPSDVFPVPQRSWVRLLVEKLPLLTLSAGSAVITVIAQRLGGAVQPLGSLPLRVRMANAVYSYAIYVSKVFWPVNFAVIYPHPLNQLTFVQVGIALLFLIGITGMVWRERSKRPYLVTGWLWFLGMLIPVIGIVQVGAQGMADRYAYLPVVGIFLILAWGGFDLASLARVNVWATSTIAVALLIALSFLTLRQVSYWRSSYDLLSHTLEVTGDNFIADDVMGDLLLRQGRLEALRYYQEAARLAPWDAVSHGAVAADFQDRGDLQNAIREYEIALRAGPDPKLQVYIYANLGIIYRQLGNFARATDNSEHAMRVDPELVGQLIRQLSDVVSAHPAAPGYFRLGLLQEGAGRTKDARASYQRALQLNPEFAPARQQLKVIGTSSPQ